MKKIYACLAVGLGLVSGLTVYAAKTIDRVINNSTQHTVSIVPYSLELDDELSIDRAYTIANISSEPADVIFEDGGIEIDDETTALKVFVGTEAQQIDLAQLEEGKNTLVIEKNGSVLIESFVKSAESYRENLKEIEPQLGDTKNQKYIWEVSNTSGARLNTEAQRIHILPYDLSGIFTPRVTMGYTLGSDDWKGPKQLDDPIIIGHDINSGVIIVADKDLGITHIIPPEFKDLPEKNELIVQDIFPLSINLQAKRLHSK